MLILKCRIIVCLGVLHHLVEKLDGKDRSEHLRGLD